MNVVEDLPTPPSVDSDESRAVFLDVIRLPSSYKQVVLLYYFHDMTMAEVAQVLNVSRSTVQHRLQKAYSLLRFQPERNVCDEEE
jgi:RNA polymerase sigma-70 factor (ECF subfamily)